MIGVDAKLGGGSHRGCHCIRNIMKLEVQKDLEARVRQGLDQYRALPGKQLLANLDATQSRIKQFSKTQGLS